VIPRMVSLTGVKEWREGELRSMDDYLVGEEPLEIRIGDAPLSVTMRTPGNDLELATGFLFTEGLITGRSQIASVVHEIDARQNGANRVRVDLTPGVVLDPERSQRNFYATSSCGICGKASIDAVRVRCIEPPNPECAVDSEVLCRLPDQLRSAQPVFSRTGGLHAAGLFSLSGELQVLREDVGRHNAVDKVVGWALANDCVPLRDSLLMVSGRGGFEIVQKALVAGVPVLASVSAPSDLAVNLAREFGMTLIGFLRGRRFVIYSGAERLLPADSQIDSSSKRVA
jgi:FdhD protein